MSKKASDPVRKLGHSSDPHIGINKKPKLPIKKPTKITVVPPGTKIPPNIGIPK